LLLAGIVSGCALQSKTDQGNAQLNTPPNPVVVAAVSDARSAHVKHPRPTPAAINAPAARPQIDQLIGLDETGIKTAFGVPSSQEDHAPTKLWVYRLRRCTMNVTFYPEVETRRFHALNYEVNSDDGSAKRQQACVAQFSSRLSTKPLAK
jgi:hypothetical protein